MSKLDARFTYRDDTKFGESNANKRRRAFLEALDAWSDDRRDAVLIGIDWLTDYYRAETGSPYWRCREYATDHAALLVTQILEGTS